MLRRNRLPSSSYSSPDGEDHFSRETFCEHPVAVLSQPRGPKEMARHVADHVANPHPFFVMDVSAVHRHLAAWQQSLTRIRSVFPLSCNADPVLARILANNDVVLEVSNTQELEKALEHVDASRVMLHSQLLTRKTVKMAGESGCGSIVIESEKQLNDVVNFSRHSEILLAVRSPHASTEFEFGCAIDEIEEILRTASLLDARLVGLCFDLGPDATPSSYFATLRDVRHIFDFARKIGINFKIIGMGNILNNRNITSFDFSEYCGLIDAAIEEIFPVAQFPYLDVFANAGRFIAANAFALCTSVTDKRQLEAKFITNDDFDEGVGFVYQTNDGVYGSFGCRQMDIHPLCKPLHMDDEAYDNDEPQHFGTIVGPSLDDTDVAQALLRCRQLRIGEWLLWEQMGAYTIPVDSEQPTPPVYYYAGRDCWEDIIVKEQRRSPSPFNDAGSTEGSVVDYTSSEESDASLDDVAEEHFYDNDLGY